MTTSSGDFFVLESTLTYSAPDQVLDSQSDNVADEADTSSDLGTDSSVTSGTSDASRSAWTDRVIHHPSRAATDRVLHRAKPQPARSAPALARMVDADFIEKLRQQLAHMDALDGELCRAALDDARWRRRHEPWLSRDEQQLRSATLLQRIFRWKKARRQREEMSSLLDHYVSGNKMLAANNPLALIDTTDTKLLDTAILKEIAAADEENNDASTPLHAVQAALPSRVQAWFETEREDLYHSKLDGHELTDEERFAVSAAYVRFSGRETPYIERSNISKGLNTVGGSSTWGVLLYAIMIAHMVLAFFEPPASLRSSTSEDIVMYCNWAEFAFVMFYLLDVGIKYGSMGGAAYFQAVSSGMYVFLVILVFVDVVVAISTPWATFRFSRPLRSILVLTRSATLQDVTSSLLRTLPSFVNIAAIIGILVVAYTVGGMHLFNGDYEDGTFDHFGSASLALFVGLTASNYPVVMIPAWKKSPWTALFFVSFMLVGIYLLINVLIGVVLESWAYLRKIKAVEARKHTRSNLLRAFRILDNKHSGYVSKEAWTGLLSVLSPDLKPEGALELFHVIGGGRLRLDPLLFFTVVDVLELEESTERRRGYVVPAVCVDLVSKYTPQVVKDVINNGYFNPVIYGIVLLNAVVLCLFGYVSTAGHATLYILNFLFLIVALIEMMLKIGGQGAIAFFGDGKNRFDFSIVSVQAVSQLILFFVEGSKAFVYVDRSLLVRAIHMLSALRVLRLISGYPRFRVVGQSIIDCLPLFSSVIYLAVLVYYSFSVVGMEMFAFVIKSPYPTASFDSLSQAFLALFQCMAMASWHDIMNASLEVSPYASWFYIIFNLVMVVIVLNILVAFMIDNFSIAFATNTETAGNTSDWTAASRFKLRRSMRRMVEDHTFAQQTPSPGVKTGHSRAYSRASSAEFDDDTLYSLERTIGSLSRDDLSSNDATLRIQRRQPLPFMGADIRNIDQSAHRSAMMDFAESGDLDGVMQLIRAGVSPNVKDVSGYTALMEASIRGHIFVVEALLDHGALLDEQDTVYGNTALMWAAWNGHVTVVRLLVNSGADYRLGSNTNFFPLTWAAMGGHTKVCRWLLDRGYVGDVDAKDDGGSTALMWASCNGHDPVVDILIANGADLHVQDEGGNTALMESAANGRLSTVRLLVLRGADISAVDKGGRDAKM